HVGLTWVPLLTQLPCRTKPGSTPPKDIKRMVLLIEGCPISGFAVEGQFCNSMTS
ncbi:Os07g0112600, partial [Oryza sativa Japonica Group]